MALRRKTRTVHIKIGGSANLIKGTNFKEVAKIINRTINKAGKIGSNFNIKNTTTKQAVNTYSHKMLAAVKSNFIHNPAEWPELSPYTVQVRRYIEDPMLFYDKFQAVAQRGNSNITLKNLKNTITYFMAPPLHPQFSVSNPSLLITGSLMNSAVLDVRSSTLNRKNKKIYHTNMNIKFMAPYARKQFFGGTTTAYRLVMRKMRNYPMDKNIKKFEKMFGSSFDEDALMNVPIPHYWVRAMQNLTVDGPFVYEVIQRTVQIPPRNPFILNDQAHNKLKVEMQILQRDVIGAIQKHVKKKLGDAL